MREDTGAVGGFFEDLPVLALVLAGVLSVASTACWCADQISAHGDSDELSREADRALRAAVRCLLQQTSLPTLESVRSSNLTGVGSEIADGWGWMVSVWVLHPYVQEVLTLGQVDGEPIILCSAQGFLNALSDDGSVVILEVRAVVWPRGP